MDIYSVGRTQADIVLEDPEGTVSKRHAELTVAEDGVRKLYLVDCGSSNGTFVQREGRWERITQDTVGADDLLRFGSSKVRMQDLLRRLPARLPAGIEAPPPARTILQPYRNAETGEIEYR